VKVEWKEADLASLHASSAEHLAAGEEERATSATRLAKAQHQAESAQAAFDAFSGEAARKQVELETRVAEVTAATVSSACALESTREQNASLQEQLDVVVAVRRQLLAVATDRDRGMTGKMMLQGRLFWIRWSTCRSVCLPTIACRCSYCTEM
jgi:hypothetical protein